MRQRFFDMHFMHLSLRPVVYQVVYHHIKLYPEELSFSTHPLSIMGPDAYKEDQLDFLRKEFHLKVRKGRKQK